MGLSFDKRFPEVGQDLLRYPNGGVFRGIEP
jgi:hypothetical protein